MSLRPIDNLRLLLDGQSPHWIPFSLDVGAMTGFSEPIERTFREQTGSQDHAAYFHTDVRCFSLSGRFGGDQPAVLHGDLPPQTTFDEWGIGHCASATEGALDKMYPPLARAESVNQVEALPSPVVVADVDSSPIARWHQAGYPVFGYAGSLYEWSWWLRGMERFMVDLVAAPHMAQAVVCKVEQYTTRLALCSAELGVDVLCFYDDAGMQRGMQVSPSLWRKFIKPAWGRVLTTVLSRFPHVRFFLHSCGKIDSIVPDIVELGFHLLHPLQPECMDFAGVYQQFGAQIALAATLSAQHTLPFGSPDDVRHEIRRLATVAADQRCMLMPSNVIQPETPWENVLAFADGALALRPAATRSTR